jgi:hypothetical protein
VLSDAQIEDFRLCRKMFTFTSIENSMHPRKVQRSRVFRLTDLPNIGKACAKDLLMLGVNDPAQLLGKNPFEMYEQLCKMTGQRHDPCLIDVFMSITRFMNGDEPRPWWKYTEQRKIFLAQFESKN